MSALQKPPWTRHGQFQTLNLYLQSDHHAQWFRYTSPYPQVASILHFIADHRDTLFPVFARATPIWPLDA